jgi:hypothetical protein
LTANSAVLHGTVQHATFRTAFKINTSVYYHARQVPLFKKSALILQIDPSKFLWAGADKESLHSWTPKGLEAFTVNWKSKIRIENGKHFIPRATSWNLKWQIVLD